MSRRSVWNQQSFLPPISTRLPETGVGSSPLKRHSDPLTRTFQKWHTPINPDSLNFAIFNAYLINLK